MCIVVAVAEPRDNTRLEFVKQHENTINKTMIFKTWEDMVTASKASGSKLCDAVIVAVHDRLHRDVVLSFAELGYDILCEKPMATSVEDCFDIHDTVVKAGIIFGMGHGKSALFKSFLLC
jgi:predicted dehydrogenase